ncbi:hypothetical protein AB3X52_04920 [Nocardioides sp. DS6]|uniref:Uncharacterized protein n=1 Tax=Nocardioides eburneus TaxID=3231482 RepID=A0ABV3SY84_9ACTN
MGEVQIDYPKMKVVAGELDDDRSALAKAKKISTPDTGVPLDGLDHGTFALEDVVSSDVGSLVSWLRHRHHDIQKVIDDLSGADDLAVSKVKTLYHNLRTGFDD